MINNIYPCVWCDNNAREAAEFYGKTFPEATVTHSNDFVSSVSFMDSKIMLLNGGPLFKPTFGLSLVIECETQEEIDHYWDAFSEGGTPSQCGWITDKYGVSWQVTPKILGKLMSDPEKVPATMAKFQTMTKMIIADLENV